MGVHLSMKFLLRLDLNMCVSFKLKVGRYAKKTQLIYESLKIRQQPFDIVCVGGGWGWGGW